MDHQMVEVGYGDRVETRPVFAYATEVCGIRRDRDVWAIDYRGSVLRLRDCLGMRYLATLLRNPDRLYLAYDLARDDQTTDGEAGARDRMVEIRSELEEARAYNDLWRASTLEMRLETESEEIASRLGLVGARRGEKSPAERARQSVTHAIRGVIRKISAHSPALGHYLDATVRTGTYCRHSPDPRMPIDWCW